VRLRGELNGHVGDIDEMWCYLGNLDVFDRTLTIPASESACPGAARRTYRNIVCHKADVERMVPRMREVDLTPEKHSLAYRLGIANQCAASRGGYQSVEAYLEARHVEVLARLEAFHAMAREGSASSSGERVGRHSGGPIARGICA